MHIRIRNPRIVVFIAALVEMTGGNSVSHAGECVGRSDPTTALLQNPARTTTRADALGIAEGNAKRMPIAKPWGSFLRASIPRFRRHGPPQHRKLGRVSQWLAQRLVDPERFRDGRRVILLGPNLPNQPFGFRVRKLSAARRAW